MENNISNFNEIVRKIESGKILLPDFQREFVWKEEERQRMIVASVLAKMPIGSILLLKSKADEYASKQIGCKKKIELEKSDECVEFLLDGQQRITVLTNVFSNVIHDKCKKVSDLVSPSLKKRFFLRIPKWSKCKEERELFGVHDLRFKYQNMDTEDPDFLTGDILSFVECISFNNDDKKPYNPQEELSTKLDDFCLTYEKGYLVPLYLLIPSEQGNKQQIVLRYKTIIKAISNKISDEIKDAFSQLSTEKEKAEFIDLIFEEGVREKIKNDESEFDGNIKEKAEMWSYLLEQYLEACIKNLSLNRIVVEEDKRDRAIDIYENLNRGGISLNTFDLIMARVAKVSKKNFYQRIADCMAEEKLYTKDVIPDEIVDIIGEQIDNKSYNATLKTGCYKEEKNEITNKYIDAFLDVLSLYCYNTDFIPEKFKLENIKRNNILRLKPIKIDANCEKICNAIDRALFFFQTRCGIRSIQEINYSLMLVLVATVFIKDEWFLDKQVHKTLEAWYWASLFSGEYDKDQNVTMINHLQSMVSLLNKGRDNGWILKLKDYVLASQNFSDEELLLMEKVQEDRFPKIIMRGFLCQYLLAKTYADMFDSNKLISVFAEEADELEAHHIIPLGTVAKVGETTAALRKDKKHICNSPLNFVYIMEKSNKMISDDSLEDYAKKICDEAKSKLHISQYGSAADVENEYKIKDLLKQRYVYLKGNIKEHISKLLT